MNGGDWFFIPADNFLHQLIPEHKIGGGGVLVNQKGGSACLNSFYNSRGLGSAAAGICR